MHSAGTTVREALLFSARLRLEESIGLPQVQRIVDQTLAMTDLTPLAGAIVGEPGAGHLSGPEAGTAWGVLMLEGAQLHLQGRSAAPRLGL